MASGNKKSGTKTSSNKKISGNLNSRSRTKQTRANVKKDGHHPHDKEAACGRTGKTEAYEK